MNTIKTINNFNVNESGQRIFFHLNGIKVNKCIYMLNIQNKIFAPNENQMIINDPLNIKTFIDKTDHSIVFGVIIM